jgi:hypothetical protein
MADGETHAQPLADTTAEQANNQNVQDGGVTKEPKARVPRPPRQRGPPEDGIPSKNKVMVANLPYDLSEEKVGRRTLCRLSLSDRSTSAQGVIRCIRAIRRKNRPPSHPSLHGQEAPGPQRTPQGPWLWLRVSRL